MNNLLAGTGIGTLFVDHGCASSASPRRSPQLINLIPTDVGRPLSDIAPRLKGDADLVGAVSKRCSTRWSTDEAQVETTPGSSYQMRVQPYRTLENVIEGAVLTFVDVSARTGEAPAK